MEIMFFKHVLSLRIILRCLHDSLLGPRIEELLYLIRELTNSSSAKHVQDKDKNNPNSSRASQFIMQYWAVLKVEYNTCQKLSSSRHSWLLNLIASGVGSFHLLTQFMSSHGPHFLLAISLILRLKNILLVLFTVLQKNFQSSRLFDVLYFLSSLLQLLSHQLLECLMILVSFAFQFHASSTLMASSLTMFPNIWISMRFEMFKFLIMLVASSKNWVSSLLPFLMLLLGVLMIFSEIRIVMVKGAWSEERHHPGWIEWLLRARELHWINMRSIVEFDSLTLSVYLVRTWLVGIDKDKSRESARIIKSSLMDEWWGKEESYKPSLMLKSPVVIRRL